VFDQELADCPRDLDAALAEIQRLNSWDGLLSILDEHYPPEVFERSPDPGARIVTLTRHLAAAREREQGLAEALEALADTARRIVPGNRGVAERTRFGVALANAQLVLGMRAAFAREDGDGR
jgi:hypothetical protein